MRQTSLLQALVLGYVIACIGCSHSDNAELAKAKAETEAAKADAAAAKAELAKVTEAAKAEAAAANAELAKANATLQSLQAALEKAPKMADGSELKKAHNVLASYLQTCITFGDSSPGAQERLSQQFQKQWKNHRHTCAFTAYAIKTEKMPPDRNDEAVFTGTVQATDEYSGGLGSGTSASRRLPPGRPIDKSDAMEVGFTVRMVKLQESGEWRVDSILYHTPPGLK